MRENWRFFTVSARDAAQHERPPAPPQKRWPGRGESVYAGIPRQGKRVDNMAEEKEPVTIKKYANRRLYNTGTSAYVTLEDR